MHDPERNENRPRGTYEFPYEYHYVASDHPRYVMSYHWHMECEVIRILSGTLMVTLDELCFPAEAGDAVFVRSGVLHSGIPTDGCIYECIVFDMNSLTRAYTIIAPFLQKIDHQEILIYYHFGKEQTDAVHAIDDIFEAFETRENGFEMTVIGQFYHFFGIVFGEHYYLESVDRHRRDCRRVIQLKQVVDFIEKNYSRQLTLEELAGAVSMSPRYFCRFFSEMTHQTPMDYVNRQRIEQASIELTTTGKSVTEIAFDSGFNDLSYFIRIFRKYKGVSPGKYRKR